MFFMRVVGVAEIVVHRYGLDDSLHRLLAKRRDPRRYHGYAANKMLAQVIVERTNLFGLRDHEIFSLSLV
jgi:hypothetical protein